MFRKLLNPENALMVTMTQVTDCIFLSLFWLLCSFPVITIGPASAALYDSVYRGLRRGDKHSWMQFLNTFRSNLKAGILPGILYLALFCAGAWGLIQVWNAAVYGKVSFMVFSGAAFFALLLLGILSILFPTLSRFQNSFAGLVRNTLLLGLVNLPRTLCVGLITAMSIALCIRFIFPLFFLPALAALLNSLFLEPMFKPYMPPEPVEDPIENTLEDAAE